MHPRQPTPIGFPRIGFLRSVIARIEVARPVPARIELPRTGILHDGAAALARHWPAVLFLVVLLASIDDDPGRLTVAAFASALVFGSWSLQMALNVVIVNLFPWWQAALTATGVTAIVWLQLWLALPGMGFVDEMVGDPRLDAGMLAMALVLMPVATAFMVRLLWHVGLARVVGDLAQAQFEEWAEDNVRVARWYGEDGRGRVVQRHVGRAAFWRPYAAGSVLVVGFGALSGLWPPAAQLMIGALIFAAPWLYRRLTGSATPADMP